MRRRDFIKAAGAAALVVGFDAAGRRWVARAGEPSGCADFADVPPLAVGALRFDDAARQAVRTDKGTIVFQSPCAVLRTSSADDIAAMVRYCSDRGIPVAARGQAHTTFGQGLSPGLIIETEPFDRITSATGLPPSAPAWSGGTSSVPLTTGDSHRGRSPGTRGCQWEARFLSAGSGGSQAL